MELFCVDRGGDEQSTLLFLPAHSVASEEGEQLTARFSRRHRTYVTLGELPEFDRVEPYARNLALLLEERSLKRVTVIGVGRGGAVSLALAEVASKSVRRAVLIDPTVRLSPGRATRFIDKVESFLPLGLPLRKVSQAFDARPFLHRIHSPVLVLLSPDAGEFEEEQGKLIANRLPNAWLRTLQQTPLQTQHLSEEVERAIEEFIEVPTKRPQKNLGACREIARSSSEQLNDY